MAEKKIHAEISRDFRLVGMASSLKEYRLCFHLNTILQCDFLKEKDLEIEFKDRTRQVTFGVFRAGEANDLNQYFVFNNKNMGDFLLPELSKFDFLLQIRGKFEDEQMFSLLNALKTVPSLILASEIPVKKVKNYERLHYETENTQPKLLKFPKTK